MGLRQARQNPANLRHFVGSGHGLAGLRAARGRSRQRWAALTMEPIARAACARDARRNTAPTSADQRKHRANPAQFRTQVDACDQPLQPNERWSCLGGHLFVLWSDDAPQVRGLGSSTRNFGDKLADPAPAPYDSWGQCVVAKSPGRSVPATAWHLPKVRSVQFRSIILDQKGLRLTKYVPVGLPQF